MIVNFQQLVLRPINRKGSRTLLDIYFENRPETDRARLKYLNTEVAPGTTKSGIFSEMIRHLSKFTLRNVGKMIAESTIDFR
ncbi:type IV secretory system conjugative DNA transfer family protein, partial [[Ruminococcus] torques]|nr:type IV secretory system conjugative DNA transfer family protein [[Ruminococcus] torques]